jgi:hypothetical protein
MDGAFLALLFASLASGWHECVLKNVFCGMLLMRLLDAVFPLLEASAGRCVVLQPRLWLHCM